MVYPVELGAVVTNGCHPPFNNGTGTKRPKTETILNARP